jgi:hypothetical protein
MSPLGSGKSSLAQEHSAFTDSFGAAIQAHARLDRRFFGLVDEARWSAEGHDYQRARALMSEAMMLLRAAP